jgi:hypothetical protein
MNADLQHARQLLRHLAPDQVAAVVRLIEVMLDPVSRALANAPPEDEEISEDEERAVAEAREWTKHNTPIPHEKVLVRLGLTMADFDRWAGLRCLRRKDRLNARSTSNPGSIGIPAPFSVILTIFSRFNGRTHGCTIGRSQQSQKTPQSLQPPALARLAPI